MAKKPYFLVTDILWDTDDEDVEDLPKACKVTVSEIAQYECCAEDEFEAEDRLVDYLTDKYGFCISSCSYELREITQKKSEGRASSQSVKKQEQQERFGLSKERYEQLREYYDNDNDWIKQLVEEWGVETCNRGYDLFDTYRWGSSKIVLVMLSQIDEVHAFDNDEEAAMQAERDGFCKIIPVSELPEIFDMKWFGWVDTPENRAAISRYCEECCAQIIK